MKNIPSNEKIVVSHLFEGVKCYVTTHNALKGKFTLYKIVDNDYQRMTTANSPVNFDEIIKKDRGN
jgi:hypothetical protein